MSISEKLATLLNQLPTTVKLVVVSKLRSEEEIMELYRAGQRDFGENRPQELKEKIEQLPSDIKWHFIGPLQRNKIKMFIDRVELIHSIDSERLLYAVNREAEKRDIVVKCLLQLHIAQEKSKQGLTSEELISLVERREEFPNIELKGLMGMASFVDNREIVSKEFALLNSLRSEIWKLFPALKPTFTELSMGMSGDWPIAVENGSTIVRVGSALFK